jgi:F-type H+-transporting ATPase subunit delta
MADNEFQVESMGEIYAQALINEAQKRNVLEDVAEDVRGIGELLKTNKLFLAFTQALSIGEEERLATLDKIFGGTPPRVHPLTLAVIKSMARRDRLMFLRGLVEGFLAIRKKMSGHVDVEVTSATELRPEVVERVRQGLAKSVGGVADVKVKVDPSLIGGMVVRIGDTQIDGSVATQLEKIEEQLKRGGRITAAAAVA